MILHSYLACNRIFQLVVAAPLILCCVSRALAQDTTGDVKAALSKGIELSQNFKDAADQFTGPFEQISDAYSTLADAVVGGHNPAKPSSPYSIDALTSKAETAASTLNSADLLPVIAPGNYSVSIDDLRGCSTQDPSLGRLNAYAAAMDQEIIDGQNTVNYLIAYGKAVDSVAGYVQVLEHDAGVLAATPNEFDGYFIGKWSELSTLDAALAKMHNAASSQLIRVQANVSGLQTQTANLHANLNLIRPGSCVLIGQWSGTCRMVNLGIPANGTLTLNNQSGQQGSFTLAGGQINANNPTVSSKTHLNMTLGPGKFAFQGDFSAQYSQFSGTFAGPGNISYKCSLNGSGH